MTQPTTDIPITLACLDMAGTTVADGGLVVEAFLSAFEAIGIGRDDPGTADRLRYVQETMGLPKLEVFAALLDGDEPRARAALDAFDATVGAAIESGQVAALPGAEQAMGTLRDRGIKVCLTTGFTADVQQRLVDALGWRDRIDLALAPGPGVRGRPHPDLVLAAILHLEVDDVRSVAVAGDTANDLTAGWRAGASVVAGVLTGSHTRAELSEAPHTHLLESVAELPALLG